MIAHTPQSDSSPVSVVMPVFNAEAHLAEAISSVLVQTHALFEFIIVDDGSTDASAGIIREYAATDSRIRPVAGERHGQAEALNAGVAMAKNDFIAYMDHDDVSLPDRLTAQLHWMKQNGVDLCGGFTRTFGLDRRIFWFPQGHESICRELLFRIALHHGTSMIRTEIARQHPFHRDVACLDYDLLTRLASRCRLGNTPQVLLKWRSHDRQFHKLNRGAFERDMSRCRTRHLQAHFPEATPAERESLLAIATRTPFQSLADLKTAGEWLVRLSRTPDTFLSARMADRWRSACLRSTQLGPGCYRLYRRVGQEFPPPHGRCMLLWLGCLLRLGGHPRWERWRRALVKASGR